MRIPTTHDMLITIITLPQKEFQHQIVIPQPFIFVHDFLGDIPDFQFPFYYLVVQQ